MHPCAYTIIVTNQKFLPATCKKYMHKLMLVLHSSKTKLSISYGWTNGLENNGECRYVASVERHNCAASNSALLSIVGHVCVRGNTGHQLAFLNLNAGSFCIHTIRFSIRSTVIAIGIRHD
jgi:hypothetical protein